MAKLTAAQRKALPAKDFAGPDRSFPIPDRKHAKAAIMDGAKGKTLAKAKAKLAATDKKKPKGK